MNSLLYPFGNILVTGSTRSGKSTAEAIRIIAAALRSDIAIVVIDPHPQSLAWSVFAHLVARGQQNRVIYDRLPSLVRVPGYGFLQPSTANDYVRRLAENEQIVREFIDVPCRRRDMQSIATSPQTEQWAVNAGLLVVNQPSPRPASDLRFALEVGHPEFQTLVDNCTSPEIQHKFREIASKTARGQFASAERLLASVCASPAFMVRCGTSLNLRHFLNQRGILLIEGGSQGISEDASRTIMGSIILQVIQYVRSRPRPFPRVLLVLDEATNANLIGSTGHEVRAMAETQKMGLDIHVLVQSPVFSSSYITDAIFTNCTTHEWFYAANDAVARLAAADLGSPDYRDSVRRLRTGQRYVKRGSRVRFERVTPLEDPWGFPGLAEKKAEIALNEVLQRPEYQETSRWFQHLNSPQDATKRYGKGPKRTQSLPTTSEDSSPLDRLGTDESPSSEDEENSES